MHVAVCIVVLAQLPAWGNIAGSVSSTSFLDPSDPLFSEITTSYTKLVSSLLGTDHVYYGKVFNGAQYPIIVTELSILTTTCNYIPFLFTENLPTSATAASLGALSAGIIKSIVSVDPAAVWIVPSSTFYTNGTAWSSSLIKVSNAYPCLVYYLRVLLPCASSYFSCFNTHRGS